MNTDQHPVLFHRQHAHVSKRAPSCSFSYSCSCTGKCQFLSVWKNRNSHWESSAGLQEAENYSASTEGREVLKSYCWQPWEGVLLGGILRRAQENTHRWGVWWAVGMVEERIFKRLHGTVTACFFSRWVCLKHKHVLTNEGTFPSVFKASFRYVLFGLVIKSWTQCQIYTGK